MTFLTPALLLSLQLALGILAATPSGSCLAGTPLGAARTPNVVSGFVNLEPVSVAFIENRGQLQEPVRFYALGSRGTVFYSPEGVVFDLVERATGAATGAASPGGPAISGAREDGSDARVIRHCAVRVSFPGSRRGPEIVASDQLPGRYNYLIGSDPSNWHRGVRSYARITFKDLWPGIDLVYRGEPGRIKSEFIIQPGGDARRIRLRYEGASKLTIAPDGSLVVETPAGGFVEDRPVALLGRERNAGRVGCRYVLPSQDIVAFDLDTYDTRRPLVIDPGIVWGTYLGGSRADRGEAIAIGPMSVPVVVGFTSSLDFPTSTGAYDVSSNGLDDIFVAALDATGSQLLYATFLGGSGDDAARAASFDETGHLLVAGETTSSDFPVTAGAYDTTHNGSTDAFVVKFSRDGGNLAYATLLGGDGADVARGIAVDSLGCAVVAGETDSPGFPTTPGAPDTTHNGQTDAFVARLSSSGDDLLFSTFLGGSQDDEAHALALRPSGDVVLMGQTRSAGFPTTQEAYDTTLDGTSDAFVTCLDGSGASLIFSTFLGGSLAEWGEGVAVDAWGEVFVTGTTTSPDFPTTPGVDDTTNAYGNADAFLTRLAAEGDALVYSTYFGEWSQDQAYAVALDPWGRAVVAGRKWVDLPHYEWAAFLTAFNPDGTVLQGTSWGGSEFTQPQNALGVAADSLGVFYATGITGDGLPATQGTYDPSYNEGGGDAFVLRYELQDASAVREPGGEPGPPLVILPNRSGFGWRVRLALEERAPVVLEVFDVRGRRVCALLDRMLAPGSHEVSWNGRDDQGRSLPSGVYLLQAKVGSRTRSGKLLILR